MHHLCARPCGTVSYHQHVFIRVGETQFDHLRKSVQMVADTGLTEDLYVRVSNRLAQQ
jgi:hypothetical protein